MGFFGHSDDAKNTADYGNISLFKRIKYLIEIIFLVIFCLGLSIFGHRINIYIYRFIFRIFFYVPVLNQRVYINLKRAYPDKSEKQLQDLSHKTWQNLADVTVDFLFAKSFFQQKDFYHIENIDIITDLQKNHKAFYLYQGILPHGKYFALRWHIKMFPWV